MSNEKRRRHKKGKSDYERNKKPVRLSQTVPTIERVLGIPSSYYFLHIEYTYIFYRVENNTIYITALYSERENFLQKMFGISLRTSESLEFWGE